MPFEKGKPKTGGRQRGTTNKFTGAFREAVQTVYNGLGGHAAFLQWAKNNPTEYYRIAARLIPVEIRESSDQTVTVIVQRDRASQPQIINPGALPDRSMNGTGSHDDAA